MFLVSLLGTGPEESWPASAAPCEYLLGFKELYDAIPATVGECLEDPHHDPSSGDARQQTTGGVFFWRKADNHTAFTDGYRTWLNGPDGVEQRLNNERLLWEVVEQARNSEYHLLLVDPRDRRERETVIRLVNGEYARDSESPPERIRAGLLSELVAVRDLDGDGVTDAAAALWLNTGGSGTFVYLIALLDHNPLLVQVGRELLGDRVQVSTIAISDDGMITVDMTAHGPGDPMCCPTQQAVKRFQASNFLDTVGPAAIQPHHISLDTQGLFTSWRAQATRTMPYDASQAPGPQGLPKHLRVTFGGADPTAWRPRDPVMYIIPVAAYQQLWEEQGNKGVANMLEKIDIQVRLLPAPPPISRFPALPYEEIGGFNDLAVQVGRAGVTEASASRNGFRFVARFAQDPNPVSRENLRYIYLGFTNDGQYLVAFFHPVTTMALPAIQDVPAKEFDRVVTDHMAYMQEKAVLLNKLSGADWLPDLAKLDALVGSLGRRGWVSLRAALAKPQQLRVDMGPEQGVLPTQVVPLLAGLGTTSRPHLVELGPGGLQAGGHAADSQADRRLGLLSCVRHGFLPDKSPWVATRLCTLPAPLSEPFCGSHFLVSLGSWVEVGSPNGPGVPWPPRALVSSRSRPRLPSGPPPRRTSGTCRRRRRPHEPRWPGSRCPPG